MNIPLSQITTTLSVFMGSEYVNDFDYNNRTYRVFVQADQPFRMTPATCTTTTCAPTPARWCRSTTWSPYRELGPPVITHYNLFRSVEIDGSAAPGYQLQARASPPWRSWPRRT
jgi:HAE1 family hydrophobic/amphiphilic exporter-1